MDIAKIDTILVEVLTIFDEVTLARLLLVNKNLYGSIIMYFCSKLNTRYQDFVVVNDPVSILTFCQHYLKMIIYYTIQNSNDIIKQLIYDYKIRTLEFDYCQCCKNFGQMTIKQKLCKNFCTIECCNKKNLLPRKSPINVTLECGCKTTYIAKKSVFIEKEFTTDHVLVDVCGSKCMEPIDPSSKKCKKCNCVPLNLPFIYNKLEGLYCDIDSDSSDEETSNNIF
jgi:hypothetical protein